MNAKIKVMILTAPGINCDREADFAFREAGAETASVDIKQLIARKKLLDEYQIMVVPGGFSYGDDIAAGKVLANQLKLKLKEDIPAFLSRGGLILGICNGFQVLAKTGILSGTKDPLTLANNDSGRFECRWVYMKVNEKSPCVFTRGVEKMRLPVAHGEGKMVFTEGDLPIAQEVLFYADEKGNATDNYPANPNGSMGNVAGVCDKSGQVFALMPHPERHIRYTQHPAWTQNKSGKSRGDGFIIFSNAVKWAAKL